MLRLPTLDEELYPVVVYNKEQKQNKTQTRYVTADKGKG